QTDAPINQDARDFEAAQELQSGVPELPSGDASADAPVTEPDALPALEESWEGDGSVETAPDDSEWGSDAPARKNNNADDDEADAIDLARSHETLQQHLHRQSLSLRLSEEDRAALHFLIESLDEDGYLDGSLQELAASLAGDDLDQLEEIEQRFVVALGLLHNMEPAGVGARDLAECLSLQLLDERNTEETRAAIAICKQPMEWLAKRDVKRLSGATGFAEPMIKAAMVVIGRLDPKPGRRFVNVERNLVVPDVLVQKSGRGFKVILNGEVMPRLRVHDIYANALKQHKGQQAAALQQRLQEARWFIKNIQQRFDTILRVSTAIVERQKNFFVHGELAMRPLVLREIADELGL
ncbi:MAG: RNA polymerase sigma-54 factor, partial [Betaproteobacteria bacterium]